MIKNPMESRIYNKHGEIIGYSSFSVFPEKELWFLRGAVFGSFICLVIVIWGKYFN